MESELVKKLEKRIFDLEAENMLLKSELQLFRAKEKKITVTSNNEVDLPKLVESIVIESSVEAFSELLVQYDSPDPAITSKAGKTLRELITNNNLSDKIKDELFEYLTLSFKVRKNSLRYKKPKEKILSLINLVIQEEVFSKSKEKELINKVEKSINEDALLSALQRYPWLSLYIMGAKPLEKSTKIEELHLTRGTYNALKQSNFNCVEDIITYPRENFFDNGKSIKYLTLEHAKEVTEILRKGGIVYSA